MAPPQWESNWQEKGSREDMSDGATKEANPKEKGEGEEGRGISLLLLEKADREGGR